MADPKMEKPADVPAAAAVVPALPAALPANVIAGVYEGSKDGEFDVAAVPVEKIPVQFQRQTVDYPSTEAVGTIIIDPAQKFLYLINGNNSATRYGISVGRDGFQWAGTALITSRQNWPMWTPPPEMIERKPELVKWEKGQPGGPENPLGARALYLTTNGVDYGYRIHGTPEWYSIGKNASSGCFRMINQDVMDLFNRVPDGAKVVVLNADGSYPTKLILPPPAPKPKASAKAVQKAKPAVAAPAPATVMPVLKALPVPKFDAAVAVPVTRAVVTP
jgi:lipoprotein-anchoring transpeptidase ErfK/SrfK